MTLNMRKLQPSAILPTRATDGSAGYDLCACLDEALLLPAHAIRVVPTGIAIAPPNDCAALVFGRSGLGLRHGIAPANAVGVVDADYRGEIMVGLINHSEVDYLIEPGERIAQLVLVSILTPPVSECLSLPETARGADGLGSTGRFL
ncbi:MAG: dUTP diphosphatase [Oscillospiraceae bacterium]